METNRSVFDTRFAELISRWNAHQELRRAQAPVSELVASRDALDEARTRIRTLEAA